jgi:hypothetical protein
MTTDVWLAEKSGSGPSEVMGIFSEPDRAKQACQDDANEYFGAAHTDELHWQQAGRLDYYSASYHHPAAGTYLFQVTRYAVDEARR